MPNKYPTPFTLKKVFTLASLSILTIAALAAQGIDPASDPNVQPYEGTDVRDYKLTFSDEFEGTEIDESKWYYRTGSKLWSTQLPANNSVSDGLFRIHLKKERVEENDTDYTGGGIITHKQFRYGYYEATMKVPTGQGWHSSFWMMRDAVLEELPLGTTHIELDPAENDSSDPYHFQTDAHRWLPGDHRKYGTKQIHTDKPLTEFNVYGLEFTPEVLRYFFNGELVSETDASIFAHNDVNVWLTCLAGKLGKKTTGVDDTQLPAQTQYQYFRFFEKKPHATVQLVSPNPLNGIYIPTTVETIHLKANASYSHPDQQATFQWEKLSGPGSVSFMSPKSLDTKVSFSRPGQYQITCSATVDDVANTSTFDVTVAAPVVHRLSHKRYGYTGADTHIRETDPQHNAGQDNHLMIGKWQGKRSRALLSFDLEPIPEGSVIEKVELSFWSDEGLGDNIGSIEIRPLPKHFKEGTGDGWRLPEIGSGASWLTNDGSNEWDTPGGDIGTAILSKIDGYTVTSPVRKTFPSSNRFVEYAQKALNSGAPLNFALISPETENGQNAYARFASNESPAHLRPILTLTYRRATEELALEEPPASNLSKPNILFLAVDDLRTELGCYGSDIAVTPNIDALAAQGLRFDRAYCQQAICGPSRASILTGARPDTIGITHNYVKIRDFNPDILTLPEHFSNNGYETVYCGKIYHHGDMLDDTWNRQPSYNKVQPKEISELKGFALEENREITAKSKQEMFEKYGPVSRFGLAMGPAVEAADVPDNEYIDGYHTDLAIATLQDLVAEQKSGEGKPFFLALGMNKPHLNWIAPQRYWDLYDRESIPMASHTEAPQNGAAMGLHASFELRVRHGIPNAGDFDPELARTLKHAYLACTSYIDAQIGRMIQALDESGVRDNTIIILWSDHGFHLGDMGVWGKATNYEIATRVPFIVWAPNMSEAAQGASTDALVELVDMYPTLCDLADIEQPEHLEGFSLKPLLQNPNRNWKKAAFSQFPNPALREWGAFPLRPAMRETFFGPLITEVEGRIKQQFGEQWDRDLFENRLMGYAMRTDRYRFIAWIDTASPEAPPIATELYDHKKDPSETRNIAAQKPRIVSKLLAQLQSGWRGNQPN
ncbi:sulfatase-like hydrolase/transferase [Pelagicoccus sp. SDUM812005]|uniref:sulfatase-like hydrolase/transferase n=1 Tax=Pelagicoccus sp. SDUM812005 TaxID=3041257 RepID=UPI00280CFE36|nr:sulfatase-like hydrolase/transferase [Pelagicoccus sp. SDUM812005]MDQ8180343.1 sulfatase-like hydrolase/transferase [Pelagicoccus sp. SDUM812005]